MLGVSSSSPNAKRPGSAVALFMSSHRARPRADFASSRYCCIFASDSMAPPGPAAGPSDRAFLPSPEVAAGSAGWWAHGVPPLAPLPLVPPVPPLPPAAALHLRRSPDLPPQGAPRPGGPAKRFRPDPGHPLLVGFAPIQMVKDNPPCNTLFVGNLSA